MSEFDRVLARANPIDDDTVAGLPLSDAESDLLEEIVSTPAPVLEAPPRRRLAVVLAAAAVAAVLTAGLVLLPHLTQAADPAGSAGTGNRLLLDATDWRLRYVQDSAAEGEVQYDKGPLNLTIYWRKADRYQMVFDDRANGRTSKQVDLLGLSGTQFRSGGKYISYTTVLKPSGGWFFELRADGLPEKQYRELLGKLRRVDQATWEAGLPAWVVTPAEEPAAIAGMLADIPRPAGLDPARLRTHKTNVRYHIGAQVTRVVTCAWIEQWDKARRSGDTAGAAQAVAALKTVPRWRILAEMEASGDWPSALRGWARTVVGGELPTDYPGGLGCRR